MKCLPGVFEITELRSEASSRLDCMRVCVCVCVCVCVWHSLSKNLELLETRHPWMNERIAWNSACASPGRLPGVCSSWKPCPENENFEKQYFLEKIGTEISPAEDGAPHTPPGLDPGSRLWFACFLCGQGVAIVCAGLLGQGRVQDLEAFRRVLEDICDGNLCKWCPATLIHMGLAIDDMRHRFNCRLNSFSKFVLISEILAWMRCRDCHHFLCGARVLQRLFVSSEIGLFLRVGRTFPLAVSL